MGRIDELKKRKETLNRLIIFARQKREEVISLVKNLASQFNSGKITRIEYHDKLYDSLRLKTPEEWIKYYDEYIASCEEKIRTCDKLIDEEKSFSGREKRIGLLKFFIVLVFIGIIVSLIFNFSPGIYNSISSISERILQGGLSSIAKLIPVKEIFVKEDEIDKGIPPLVPEEKPKPLKVMGEDRPSVVFLNKEASFSEENVQYQAVVGEKVRWKKGIVISGDEEFKLNLPLGSEKISVLRIIDGKESIVSQIRINKERGFLGIFGNEGVSVDKLKGRGEYGVIYETPAPEIKEERIGQKTRVTIKGPDDIHYTDVLSFSDIPEKLKPGEEYKIKLHQIFEIDGSSYEEAVEFSAYDTNENGFIDKIEWITPQLSEAVFEISIINITKAEHLNSNRESVSDIYESVKTLDGIWSEKIYDNEYIRVKFEKTLTSSNDITFYARNIENSKTIVEVYLENGNEKIAEFPIIDSENKYKIYLTNLGNISSDVFDLKIKNLDDNKNAYLEFDYIVDPTFQVGLDVLYPLDLIKTMNVTQNKLFNVTLNVTCLKGNCGEVKVSLALAGNILNERVDPLKDTGRSSSIALDSNGKIHISYSDKTNNNRLKYCNNIGGSWSCEYVGNNPYVSRSSIAIDSNDKVYIAYQSYPTSGYKSLMYCNNIAGWSCSSIDSGELIGTHPSIAIDKNDKIHISYQDSQLAKLKYCNNIAGWSCSNIDSVGTNGFYSSIAIDSNNKVHISHGDNSNKNLRYCNNIDGSWGGCSAIEGNGNLVQYSSIAIDSNNKAHISYYDYGNKDLRYCDNTVGIWNCGIVDGTVSDVGTGSSIAIDSNDKAHISYYDTTNVDLKYCNNMNGWNCKILKDNYVYLGLGDVNGRGLAIKKGRIVDSNSFDDEIHISWYNGSNLMHTSYQYKKGLISNIVGASPFYAITQNPYQTGQLDEGKNETVVFWVNATGEIGSIWKFFAYANMSSDMSIGNMSDKWEVRIKSEFEVDSCRILDKPNSVYNQTADIINPDMNGIDACINITAENITFNGNGHQIIGSSDNTKRGIYSNSSNTTIMNAKIERFGYGIKINSNYSFIFNNSLNHQLNGFGIYLESSSNNRIINNNADYNDAISEGIGIYLSNSHNNSLLNNSASFNFVTGISLYHSSNNTLINNSANSNGNGLGDGKGISLSSSSNNTLINITANSNYLYGVYLFDSSNNVLINNSANGNGFYGFYLKSSSGNTFNLSRGSDNYYNLFLIDSSNANEFIDASAAGNSAYSFEFYNSNNNVVKDSYLLFTNTILSHQNSINNTLLNCTYNLAQESVEFNSELIRKWHYRAYVQDESLVPVDKVNVSAYNVSGNYNFNLTTDISGYTPLGEIIDYVNIGGGIRNYYSNYTMYADNRISFDEHTFNSSLGNNLMDVFTLAPIKPPEIIYISDLGYVHPEINPIDPILRDLLADDSARKDFEFYAYSKNIQQLPIFVNNDNALLTVINKNFPSIERKSSNGGKAIVCSYDRNENAPNEALPGYAGKLCRVYRCSVAMQYYDDYGGSQNPNWEVKAYIKDGLGFEEGYKDGINTDNSVALPVRETYFNILQDSKLVPEAEGLNFGEVGYGQQVREPIGTYPLRIRNTGNADITSVKVTGKNIPGVTNPAEFIQASWFKVSQVGQSCGSGISLVNNVPVDSGLIVIAHAPNSYSEMRICLTNVEGVSRQSYSASGDNAWLIDTSFQGFLVAVAIGIKRKKRKKNKVPIEKILNDFEKKLKEKYGIGFDELLKVREEKLRKTGIFDKVLTEKEIKIPLELFSQEIGCAEALCKYLKEEKGLRLSEIAKLLNRDQRTIGINYRNSLKRKIAIEVKDYEKAVPVEIFSDRRMSILESVVNYLREKGIKNSEIALMLGKDPRNIGTLYSRVREKIKN